MDLSICCVAKGCNRPEKNRGLCHTHYQNLLRHVRLGKTTWEKEERNGRAKPPRPRRNRSIERVFDADFGDQ